MSQARALMLQGTGSDVGKSLLVAGLCRILKRRGQSVAPFKPQNMSNNAAVCQGLGQNSSDQYDGGEIGRAQALQARAAGLPPQVDFNPVLLKPQSDQSAQVVVHGKVLDTLSAAEYMGNRHRFMDAVQASFQRLKAQYDWVIVEGAGSPAEINLRERDIANMGFARKADVPVCLVGDIDRGGVIAAVVGTKAVLEPADADMIGGFIINKFRGDPQLFEDGVTAIENRTGWPCFGVIPWLSAAALLPAEDAVALDAPVADVQHQAKGLIRIAAPMLSRMANFDDADPLRQEPNVDFAWVKPGQTIPQDVDAVILFGTKSTQGDLAFMQAQGWDHDIHTFVRNGGRVFGICGGYQMLGNAVHDPNKVEGELARMTGLGLLDVDTEMLATKCVKESSGVDAQFNTPVSGYKIHTGKTWGNNTATPMFILNGHADGAQSHNGRVQGTYLHGLFNNDAYRKAWLNQIRSLDSTLHYEAQIEKALDALADGLEAALDIDALLSLAR